jgi:CBS domain containing-hemolysin-like protein
MMAASGAQGFAPRDWIYLIALVLTLVIAGAAAAAETALTSVNRIRIKNQADEEDKVAQRIERLLEQPHLFITTILVVSNLSVITASTLATLIAVDLNFNGAEVISTIVLSLVVLLFCEITPKTAAVRAPERWSRTLVGPVETLMRIMLPLITLLTLISNGIIRLFGAKPGPRLPFVTEDELRMMMDVSEEEGVVEEEEREMIDNIFEFNDTSVREVMVPRIDIVAIEADTTVDEATSVVLQGGQSRVPVYEDTLDEIVGLLYAKDLLRALASGHRTLPVRDLMRRTVYFVPDSKRLDDLLRELQKKRVHLAIVTDRDSGAVVGLVTIEDLVEEIIGDIKDEYDVEEPLFQQLSETEYLLDARLPVYEFNELLNRKLPEETTTVGGFVTMQLDKIPTIGDVVSYENLTFTVLDTKGRRVTRLKLVVHPTAGEEPAEGVTSTTAEERSNRAAPGGAPADRGSTSAGQPSQATGAQGNGVHANGARANGAATRTSRGPDARPPHPRSER